MTPSRAILLLSGGLDSLVSSAMARERHAITCALTFDYGQRAGAREIEAARALCDAWEIPHRVIVLPWLSDLTKTALVNPEGTLPRFDNALDTLDDPETSEASAKAVWVPNRNGVFLNIAAAFAESTASQWIVTGFNAEEAATFPDNSAAYVERANAYLELSTLATPQLVSYTQTMTKAEILEYAVRHELPLASCWPCYEGGEKWCGTCESCSRLRRAMEVNQITNHKHQITNNFK